MKIIALNSGGFDSIVMLHKLRKENPSAEIHSLFFNYDQRNFFNESIKAYQVCQKLDLIAHYLQIPKISWTKQNFYGEDFENGHSQYLEMRNMIFLSYAASFAESVGATFIYFAVLKSHWGYKDTSVGFCKNMNELLKDSIGVRLETPFINKEKIQLAELAFKYGVLPGEYFTCDTPVSGKPCGKCNDCKEIEKIEEYLTLNTPFKVWSKTRDVMGLEFQAQIKKASIKEMRVLINNDCQLNCGHCFYGFKKMSGKILTHKERFKVYDEAVKLGIKNFHFSGKEPLYDGRIFIDSKYLREKYRGITFDVVTNGINIPTCVTQLKEEGFSKVFLSVDNLFGETKYRKHSENNTVNALEALQKYEIPCEVFIDLHTENYSSLLRMITKLYNQYGVRNFFIREIYLIGGAKKEKHLDSQALYKVYSQLLTVSYRFMDANFVLRLPNSCVYNLLQENSELSGIINDVWNRANFFVTNNFELYPEIFCTRFYDQITLTPDGYILGCATDVSCKDYSNVSVGNVREKSLCELIQDGKNQCIEFNKKCKNSFCKCARQVLTK